MGRTTVSLEQVVAELVDQGMRAGTVPADVLLYASEATRAALSRGAVSGDRARRYFSAVVRRRLVRRCGGTTAAGHVVAEAVVADLLDSGRAAADIAELLARDWAGRLPGDVIEEWRSRLCA